MNTETAEKVALVTGAATGNGLAIAQRLLQDGATVAFLDRDEDALHRATEGLERALPIVADVGDPASVESSIKHIETELGALHIVVNNAGIVRFSDLENLDLAEWEEVFRVNTTGPFLVSKAAVRLMRQTLERQHTGTGSIINITSIEAHIVVSSSGHPQIHYNASKGAVVMFTKAMAVECAKSRIRVNAVAPGFIDTAFTRDALQNEATKNWILERVPLNRIGRPEDVAGAVSFLASSDSGFVTGSTIFVDGGWTAL